MAANEHSPAAPEGGQDHLSAPWRSSRAYTSLAPMNL